MGGAVVGLDRLVRARVPGHTLAREFYADPAVLEEEFRRVFFPNWLFAGLACDVAAPGDFFTFSVGEESAVVVRDRDGRVRAFANVCRHRGSRVVLEERGRARALVCPYHQWAYGLDGRLAAARHMGEGFDGRDYGLAPVALRDLAGLLFVCFSPEPPPFEAALEAVGPQLRPHRLDRAKVVRRYSYEVAANWKLLVENNRECYHCRGSHPEFCLSNFDLGVNGDRRRNEGYEATRAAEERRWEALGLAPREVSFPDGAWYRVARLPLREGFATESLDGALVAPLMGELTEPRTGSLRVVGLPNFWAHANCDYAVTTRLRPLGPHATAVELAFLVREDAVEGRDYDPERLVEVWKATSEQDWVLCENNAAGVRSAAYRPGPYSEVTEGSVEAFVRWYLAQLGAPAPPGVPAGAGVS